MRGAPTWRARSPPCANGIAGQRVAGIVVLSDGGDTGAVGQVGRVGQVG